MTRQPPGEVVHDQATVTAAYDRLAAAIDERCADGRPTVLMAVLRGGLVAASALYVRCRRLALFDRVQVSRYQADGKPGAVSWITRPGVTVRERRVVLVDDILDEGETLRAVSQVLEAEGAEVLRVVLCRKQHGRAVAAPAHLVGLDVPDRWVFGCGMDLAGAWRELPEIRAVDPGWRAP